MCISCDIHASALNLKPCASFYESSKLEMVNKELILLEIEDLEEAKL